MAQNRLTWDTLIFIVQNLAFLINRKKIGSDFNVDFKTCLDGKNVKRNEKKSHKNVKRNKKTGKNVKRYEIGREQQPQ